MGLIFVLTASLCVAVGTYILSSAFSVDSVLVTLVSYKHPRILLVVSGFTLNLLGSGFWILARRFSASYLLSWTLYLGFLVLFGAVIATWIEQESISVHQIFGLILLTCGLTLLKA